MDLLEIPQLSDLSIPEKILLVEDLWDSIPAAGVAVADSHRTELDRRLDRHRKNPGPLLSLADLQGRLAKRS